MSRIETVLANLAPLFGTAALANFVWSANGPTSVLVLLATSGLFNLLLILRALRS
jgi:hypothetical protein